jgi:hypothetical protein
MLRASIVLAAVAVARPAAAEINMADSIEWVTADSDVVARGTIDKVAQRGDWFDVTFAVAETIKGPKRNTLAITFSRGYGETPEQLRARKAELLVFLVEGKRLEKNNKEYAGVKLTPRHGWGDTPGVFDLGKPAHAFNAAFAVLGTRDEILAATRGAAKSTAAKAFRVDLPSDSAAYRALYGGSAVWFNVPIDDALEPRAIAWIADKDVSVRVQGVGALESFRSEANAARLKKLLADDGFYTQQTDNGPRTKHYPVRAKAHEVLDGWHVKHATPVIDEAIP